MQLPVGASLWSAFWMLGADLTKVGWPGSGSIDVVENVAQGLGPSAVRSTIHGPGYAGVNGLSQDYALPGGGRVDDAGYHAYGVIWSPRMLQFYVDSPTNVFFVRRRAACPTTANATAIFFLPGLASEWGSRRRDAQSGRRRWTDTPINNAVSAPTLHNVMAGQAGTSRIA
jgi:hypothetical protein